MQTDCRCPSNPVNHNSQRHVLETYTGNMQCAHQMTLGAFTVRIRELTALLARHLMHHMKGKTFVLSRLGWAEKDFCWEIFWIHNCSLMLCMQISGFSFSEVSLEIRCQRCSFLVSLTVWGWVLLLKSWLLRVLLLDAFISSHEILLQLRLLYAVANKPTTSFSWLLVGKENFSFMARVFSVEGANQGQMNASAHGRLSEADVFMLRLKLRVLVLVRHWSNTTPLSHSEFHPILHCTLWLSVHTAFPQDKLFLLQQAEWQLI